MSLYKSKSPYDYFFGFANEMSKVDKKQQTLLYNMYRLTTFFEDNIANMPDEFSEKINSSMIDSEIIKQRNLDTSEINSDNIKNKFVNSDKEWYFVCGKFINSLIDWQLGFTNIENYYHQFYCEFKKIKETEWAEYFTESNSKIEWTEIKEHYKLIITRFYKGAAIMIRYCQLNILDVFNNTNRFWEVINDMMEFDEESEREDKAARRI